MRSVRKPATNTLISSSTAFSILYMISTMIFLHMSHGLHSSLALRPTYIHPALHMVTDSKSLQKQLRTRLSRHHSSAISNTGNSDSNRRSSYGSSSSSSSSSSPSSSFVERKELRWSEYLSLPKELDRYVVVANIFFMIILFLS
jgi:hypothetical protein